MKRRNTSLVVPVCARHLGFLSDARSKAPSELTVKGALVDSDVDATSSNTQHKPTSLSSEKRSTEDARRESGRSESSSDRKLPVSLESPLSKFCIAARVDLISVVGSGAKILLNIAKDSSDVFTPLKSVLGGISAICDQYEVRLRTSVLSVTDS